MRPKPSIRRPTQFQPCPKRPKSRIRIPSQRWQRWVNRIKKLKKWKTFPSRADVSCLVAVCLTDLIVNWSFVRSRATNSPTASSTSTVKTSTCTSRRLTTIRRCFLKTYVTTSSLTGRGRRLTISYLAMASRSHVHRLPLPSRSKIRSKAKKTKRPFWGFSWSIKMVACGPTISLS